MQYKTLDMKLKADADGRHKTKGCLVQNLVCFILCVISITSQTISWSQSMDISTKELTIQNSFDKLTIQTYAAQGQSKVEELFEYLKLTAMNENSPELEEQLLQNIHQLFTEKSVQLVSIDNKTKFYSTKQWINDWKNSKITLERLELVGSQLKNNHWLNQYQLIYKVNGKQKTTRMEVQIFFYPELKYFGETKKEVWELKIGSIDFK